MTDNTYSGSVSIGELSQRTGVPVRTIRFYCDEGVLDSRRTSGGHRVFDPTTVVDQLLLVRRLRALGLGLTPIVDVLHGTISLEQALAAQRRALDTELDALTWRRAALRTVESAPATERTARLELIAAVQDPRAASDAISSFWRRMLAPAPSAMFDDFVAMNLPDPPADPTVHHVVAYAEIVALVADPAFATAMARQVWRSDHIAAPHRHALLAEMSLAYEAAAFRILDDENPRPGTELDQFVAAHAAARGERDTPRLRRQLLLDNPDPRVDRYWTLTDTFRTTPTVGTAAAWLDTALAVSVATDAPLVS
ncbi:MerR family transcriptional regulator [Nocardia callitridis]|uniref:MerR family transcriptional regulator n=1 Tax=Nocardia callitridis TaxID=648753 RepID=A0ABP9KEU4_9NOCA